MKDDQNQPVPEEEIPDSPSLEEPSGEPSEEGSSGAPSSDEVHQENMAEKEALYHKTLTRLKREMLRAQKENADLREKLRDAETVSTQMGQSALESFKMGAQTMMEKARTALKHAHEVSDVDGILIANEDLAKAAAQLQWASTVPPLQPQKSRKEEPEEEVHDPHPATQVWVSKNPWIQEASPLFDSEKASAVISYATTLEQQMIHQGRGHEINTPSYFKALDAYVRYWEGQQGDHKTMKHVTTVASTKTPPSEGSINKNNSLSADEKAICQVMGISEAGYLKQKKAIAVEKSQMN